MLLSSRIANKQSAVRPSLSRQYVYFFLPLVLFYTVQHEVHDNKVIGTICFFKCSNVTKLIVPIGVLFQPFLYGLNPYSRNVDAWPLPDNRRSTLCRDIRPEPDP